MRNRGATRTDYRLNSTVQYVQYKPLTITKMNAQEYAEYKASVERFTEGLTFISTGSCTGCDECNLSENCTDHERELAEEPYFSWQPCECCGSGLGGNRHPAHGFDKDDNLIHFAVCEDCLYYLNYGCLDDMTMLEIEESKTA